MDLVVVDGVVAVEVGFGCGGGWVGLVIGYICSWGVVFVVVVEEKKRLEEREMITFYYFIK